MKENPRKKRLRKDSTPIGREIVESLTELAAVLESGRSDLKHFKNRTIAGSGKISEQRRRTDYLEEINADYAALNKNRTAMADFKKEMDAWDVTNLDGLARND
jgi:hypothetical protein